MQVSDFIARFRLDRGDTETPYFWTDAEIVSYLNDAVDEACERADLLIDSTTSACCSVTLVANQGEYPLHVAVDKVLKVSIAGKALTETSLEDEDADEADWETKTGEPERFIFDGQVLRLVPAPASAGTAALRVSRRPLAALVATTPTGTPEIAPRHHLRLLSWMHRCALLKQDAETVDKAKASEFDALFEADFGRRDDANVKRKKRNRAPARVAMNPTW